MNGLNIFCMANAQQIKQLRDQTGAGIMDVKQALEESGGDTEKALEFLRKKGMKVAAKKQDRVAKEGIIEPYIHAHGKVGVLVALACETDFVARNEEFKALAHDIALQVAATDPLYLVPTDVPAEVIAKEKDIYREQMKDEKKPPEVLEKIIEGKLNKYFEQVCLMQQVFVKDDSQKILDLVTAATAKLGEKIEVRKFVRFTL